MEGLRVVGSAGDDKKVKFLMVELDFDAAFNYKKEAPKDALPKLCPDGIGIAATLISAETNSRRLLGERGRRNSRGSTCQLQYFCQDPRLRHDQLVRQQRAIWCEKPDDDRLETDPFRGLYSG